MRKKSDLNGSGDLNSMTARNGLDQKVDPLEVCFPIAQEYTVGKYKIIGTGFFVLNFGVFVTARHVFEDVIDFSSGEQSDALVILHAQNDGSFITRSINEININNNSDIALGIVANDINNEIINKTLDVSFEIPAVNSRVFTYAFPASECLDGKLNVVDGCYPGVIKKIYEKKRDSVLLTWPVIETTMYIHSSASGGPVFYDGKVFAVNTSSLEVEGGVTSHSYVTPVVEAAGLYVPGLINHDGCQIILADALKLKGQFSKRAN